MKLYAKSFIDARTEDIILLDNLPDVMNEVKRSVVSAVKFLYEECRVVDVKLLPYTYQLIMLALFFKENKTVGYRVMNYESGFIIHLIQTTLLIHLWQE